MKKIILATSIIFFCAGTLCSNAGAYDNGDFQIWDTNAEDIKIGKDTKLTMEQEFRFGKNASEFFSCRYFFTTQTLIFATTSG